MRIRKLIIGIFATLVLSGCGSEFRLANKFVAQSHAVQAAVYFPESASVTLIQDGEGNYTDALDSLNQDVFLDIMYLAYADEMSQYGVKVYVPDDADHVPVDSLHWLVVLSKVEIQGLFTEYVDHLFDFVDDYDYTFSLNTVNVASWFDVNNGMWLPTLFDEHNLMDDFNSYVTRNGKTGTQYHYEITPIFNDDLYDYAVFLGKRYAAFTYNYMMNRYIEEALQQNNESARFQLRWDPQEEHFFYQQEGEGFLEVEN